jgi:predicted kinase
MQTKTLQDLLNEDLRGVAIILRGGPGSKKDTVAAAIHGTYFEGCRIFSADDFRQEKSFSWDHLQHQAPHDACLRAYVDHVRTAPFGATIVVANTHVTAVEAAPYVALAIAYGFRPLLVTLEVDLALALARTQDKIPGAKVREMHRRVNSNTVHVPPTWRHYVINVDSVENIQERAI